MDLDALLVDLQVIGQLRGGDKLAVNCDTGRRSLIIHHSGLSQSVRRWYVRSTRTEMIDYVEELVRQCERATKVIAQGNLCQHATKLTSAIDAASGGLSHLQSTYSDDSAIVSRVTLCTTKMHDVRTVLESVQPPSPPTYGARTPSTSSDQPPQARCLLYAGDAEQTPT